jgi:hypothetical protein
MTHATRMHWTGRNWIVTLFRGDTVVATMTLDEWMELGATPFAIEDAVRIAGHASQLCAPANRLQ